MRTEQLDRRALHEAPDRRRQADGLTWRRVVMQAGVVPSTLSRLNVGYGSPSADSLLRLLAWLGTSDVAPFVTAALRQEIDVYHDTHARATASARNVPA